MRVYRVRLVDMYRGIYSAREVAVYVLNLPRGAQTWQHFGGANAVTAEEENEWVTHLLLQQMMYQKGGGKGQKPKLREYPEGIQAQREKEAKTARRAERFKAKHLNG